MKFCELLNQYINTLNCTGKEISDRSGISPSVISRYRSGERVPQMDSDIVIMLAKALSTIAATKDVENMSEEIILSSFTNALLSKSKNYEKFLSYNTLHSYPWQAACRCLKRPRAQSCARPRSRYPFSHPRRIRLITKAAYRCKTLCTVYLQAFFPFSAMSPQADQREQTRGGEHIHSPFRHWASQKRR